MVDNHQARIFIGGEWVAPLTDERIEVLNPATEAVIGSVPACGPEDADRAIEAARAAFRRGAWANAAPESRAAILDRFAEALERRAALMADILTAEGGFPASLARAVHVDTPIAFVRYYADLIRTHAFERRIASGDDAQIRVRQTPVGVASLIVSWNVPIVGALTKLSPALAAGCAIVFKPSPETPLSAYCLAEAAQEAGFPPGVFNMMPARLEGSERLCSHPEVDMVGFTGSTAVGKVIGAACAAQVKRCALELGGNAAAIVLPDAPRAMLEGALPYLSFIMNNGQACLMQRRILAPRARYDEIVSLMACAARACRVGDPSAPDTALGPMITKTHQARVLSYAEIGRKEGAEIIVGGARPEAHSKGFFVEPTVMAQVSNAMRVAREEIFGPVACIIPYDEEDEALAIAADTEYGLTSSIWTGDPERGAALGQQLRVGTVYVNDTFRLDPRAPFGGFGHSGHGREMGPEGLAEYCETQSILIPNAAPR